jgi:branched-chain amino acid transport system ATP-binding protein
MIILECQGVSKHFGGIKAVDNVDLQVKQGEILGLIGPNGSGKTTLVNVISGIYSPNNGKVLYKGELISGLRPHKISRMGIARTFQIDKPFRNLTVHENVNVGMLFGRGHKKRSMHSLKEGVDELLKLVGLWGKRDMLATDLTVPDRKRLELAKALAMEPNVILLDEVMAGLNTREIGEAMELIKDINQQGKTILVIEHVMKAIVGICHRILVLSQGKKIAEGDCETVMNDEAVIKVYLGDRYTRVNVN